MAHYYPTPSPSSHTSSSHASSILRRALDPVDAADAAVMIPVSAPLAEDTASLDNGSNSPPREKPVYCLFGLDRWASDSSSTVGSDFTDDFKRVRHMVLPPPPTPCPEPIKGFTSADIVSGTFLARAPPLFIQIQDVFGPVRHHLCAYTHRRATAAAATHRTRVRTASWIRKLRAAGAEGCLLNN